MKKTILSLSVLCALAQPLLASTPSLTDQPGAVRPVLPKPFVDKVPTIGPQVVDKVTPQNTTKADKSAPKFLVKRVEVLGLSEHSSVDSLELNKLAERLRLKMSDDSGKLSVPQLHEIADALTNYIRKEGYILSRVYLPAQKLNDERFVRFRVREGYLGQVIIHGNHVYSKTQLEEPFENLIGKPVKSSEIESALVTINQFPGIKVKAIFQKGKKPGETDLDIKVISSHRLELILAGDNLGTKTTGRYRSTVQLSLYNLTHGADDLQLDYLQKYNPNNSHYYQINYSRKLIWDWTRFLLSYSYNDYSLGHDLQGQGFGGESQVAKAQIEQYFHKDRYDTYGMMFGLTHNVGFLKQNSTMQNRDKLTIANLTYMMTMSFPKVNAFSYLSLTYDRGFNDFLDSMGEAPDGGIYPARQGANGEYAEGKFNKESLYYVLLASPFKYQMLSFDIKGQFSDDLLTSFSQMSFGGMGNMMAYQTNEFLSDKGYYTSLLWEFPIPGLTDKNFFHTKYEWGNVLRIAPFAEYGAGWNNDPTGSDQRHIALADYGLDLRIRYGKHFKFEAAAARPFPGATQPSDEEKERFWVGVNYDFEGF